MVGGQTSQAASGCGGQLDAIGCVVTVSMLNRMISNTLNNRGEKLIEDMLYTFWGIQLENEGS